MDYEVRLTNQAEADLASLHPWLRDVLHSNLDRLAKTPSLLGRKTVSFPFGGDGMMYEFDHGPIGNTYYYFTIIYRFSQDETSLVVTKIGFREYDPTRPL